MVALWRLALFSLPWASRQRLAGFKGDGGCVGAGRGRIRRFQDDGGGEEVGVEGVQFGYVIRRSSSVNVVKDSKWKWR